MTNHQDKPPAVTLSFRSLTVAVLTLPSVILPFRFLTVAARIPPVDLVGLEGLEPSASPLSGVRSNQLSYRPVIQFLLPSNLCECPITSLPILLRR